MKTILLFTILFTALLSWSQSIPSAIIIDQHTAPKPVNSNQIIGTIVWHEDFDQERWFETVNEEGLGYVLNTEATLPAAGSGDGIWSTNSIGEETIRPEAMLFHWSNVGPRGRWSSILSDSAIEFLPPNNQQLVNLPQESSSGNGFMMLESDYSNSTEPGIMGDFPVLDLNAYIMCGPIDLSNIEAAMFSMNTYYRFCCNDDASLALDISIDYDPSMPEQATWGTFTLNNKTKTNDYTYLNTTHFYDSERNPHINISTMQVNNETVPVVGNSNVYIRLHQSNASHYFWIVDDLTIYEPPVKDLIINDGFADYLYENEEIINNAHNASNNFYGGYSTIPQSVVGPFVKFRAAVVNNGQQTIQNAKATLNITKDGTTVYSKESDTGVDININTYDTLNIISDYTPCEPGNYKALLSTIIEGQDGNPNNNQWEYNFKIGGDYWSTVYHGSEDLYGYASPKDEMNSGYDGDAMVQTFLLPESAEPIKAYGINFFFHSHRDREYELDDIENGAFGAIGKIWEYDAELDQITPTSIASDIKIMTLDDTASWINLPFIDNENLYLESNKTYLAGIEVYTGNISSRFMVGKDLNGPKQSQGGGLFYQMHQITWLRTETNYAIELVLGDQPSVYKKATFNLDVSCDISNEQFNPEEDTIFLIGEWAGLPKPGSLLSTKLYKSATEGVFAGTAHTIEANQSYTYRYYIGSGRSKPISDYLTLNIGEENLIINDVWDCSYVTIKEADQAFSLMLYPNPVKNSVWITNAVSINTVFVSNSMGQIIKKIKGKGKTLELSTENLEAGVYQISIIDVNNNNYTRKIVKQ